MRITSDYLHPNRLTLHLLNCSVLSNHLAATVFVIQLQNFKLSKNTSSLSNIDTDTTASILNSTNVTQTCSANNHTFYGSGQPIEVTGNRTTSPTNLSASTDYLHLTTRTHHAPATPQGREKTPNINKYYTAQQFNLDFKLYTGKLLFGIAQIAPSVPCTSRLLVAMLQWVGF